MREQKSRSIEKTTAGLVVEQTARLKEIFPECVTEGKVDIERLRVALGEEVDSRPERYSFTWAGKRDSIRLLQTPSHATLVPCPEESVNFEETGNLFIEGDNLEVLKLLYRPYFGRVKMIYIDPPYNTGNDFIYPDDFADPLDTYLQLTGQKDGNGNLLTSNPETSGRYHSAWLTMMYPRLFVARQLLRDDGIIFVSIDDHELHNIRQVMNEIFGEENFLATFVRRRRMTTAMRGEPVSPDHEYVVSYARLREKVLLFPAKVDLDYPFQDPKGRYRSTDLTVGMTKEMRPNQFYSITDPRTGATYSPPEDRVWRFQPERMAEHIAADNIAWPGDFPERRMTRPRFKTRKPSDDSETATKPTSTWIDSNRREDGEGQIGLYAGLNQEATKELKELFNLQVAEYPKPVSLIVSLLGLATAKDDLVVDFFAGTSTTAHAVLEASRKSGIRRRFIMVQLPEPTPPESTAGRAGFRTIAEIGKERIRRVIANLKQVDEGKLDIQTREMPEDLGFRVFKLAESNYRQWTGAEGNDPEAYAETMALFLDPLVEGWKPENVIWEVAIKEGYGLNSHIELVPGLEGNSVYRVTDPDKEQSFLICLDKLVDASLAGKLHLDRDDLFVCRDVALNDESAANLALQCRLRTI